MQSNDKIISIQYLRGIACLLVLFHHISLTITNKGVFDRFYFESRNGVQLFFIISGFIIPYSLYKYNYQIKNFFRFIVRRMVRIDIPMWITILFIFILGTSYNFCNNISLKNLNDFKVLLYNLFYLIPLTKHCWYDGIFWTLGLEFQYYLLMGLLFPILLSKYKHVFIVLSIIIWVVSFTYLQAKVGTQRFIPSQWIFFSLGQITFLYYIQKLSKTQLYVYLFLHGAILFILYSKIMAPLFLVTPLFILYIKKELKWFSFIGTISYSLYLSHPLVLSQLNKHIHFQNSNTYLPIITSLTIAYIFYISIEKQALSFSKKIKQ